MEVQGGVIDKKSTLNSEAVSNKGNNLDRPFGGVVGSNNCCRSGGNEVMGNIYRDDISLSSSSSSLISFNNNNSNMSATRRGSEVQPFEIFPSVPVPAGYSPFKSPGGGMASSVGFPFTSAQWKELQRQAMVYKCMISSVPVPPDLLFPLTNSTTPLYNGRYSKNGDPEPGRCKRTDGKKWRCSRDVAPHQKYCERHLHRGRPRSRKPVEAVKTINNAEINKKTRVEQQIHLRNNSGASVVAQQLGTGQPDHQQSRLFFNPETDLKISATAPFKGTNHREMDLMLEGEMVAMNVPEQQWKNFIGENMGYSNESSIYTSTTPMYHRDYMDAFSYSSTFPTPEIENPTGYIDAWSLNNFNNNTNVESSISPNNGNLSPSLTLSMAMAAGNTLDEEMGKIHDTNDSTTDHKNKDWKWSNPVSWEPFSRSGPGGPLAEALHTGSVPTSPYDSHPATAVSSPSGVLHRTLFSNSDGSVCNSPTLAAAPPSEIAFQWLN